MSRRHFDDEEDYYSPTSWEETLMRRMKNTKTECKTKRIFWNTLMSNPHLRSLLTLNV